MQVSHNLKIKINKTVFDGEPSIVMPPPVNVSVTFTFDPMTLKTYLATPTHIMTIYGKFHSNASIKYGDVTSRVKRC